MIIVEQFLVGSDQSTGNYFLIEKEYTERSVVYQYAQNVSGKKLPFYIGFIDTKDKSRSLYRIFQSEVYCYKKIDKTPEELGLHIPSIYRAYPPAVNTTFDKHIPKDIQDAIRSRRAAYKVVWGSTGIGDDINISSLPCYNKALCLQCGCILTESIYHYKMKCSECNMWFSEQVITPGYKQYIQDNFYLSLAQTRFRTKCSQVFYCFDADDSCVNLYKIKICITAKDDCVDVHYKLLAGMTWDATGFTEAYRYSRNTKLPVDPFSVMSLSRYSMPGGDRIVYVGANSCEEFILGHMELFASLGFMQVLKNMQYRTPIESLFLVYLTIINKYPTVLTLLDEYYSSLFISIYDKLRQAKNKLEIEDIFSRVDECIYQKGIEGRELKIPEFAIQYCMLNNVGLDELHILCTAFSKSRISEKTFWNLVNSIKYHKVRLSVDEDTLIWLLKRGYTLPSLIKYLTAEGCNPIYKAYSLRRYLELCYVNDRVPAKYPEDLSSEIDKITSIDK